MESSASCSFFRPKRARIKGVLPVKAPNYVYSIGDKGTTIKEEFGLDVYFCQAKNTNVQIIERIRAHKKS